MAMNLISRAKGGVVPAHLSTVACGESLAKWRQRLIAVQRQKGKIKQHMRLCQKELAKLESRAQECVDELGREW